MQGPVQNNVIPVVNQNSGQPGYTFEQFQQGVPPPVIQPGQAPNLEIKPPVNNAVPPVSTTPPPITEPPIITEPVVEEWKFIDMDVWDIIFWPIEKPGEVVPQPTLG